MHAARELSRQRRVDHAVTFDPALPPEGLSHDIDPEMRLPARPVACMAFVLVGFIDHAQALRRESSGQLLCDDVARFAWLRIGRAGPAGQSGNAGAGCRTRVIFVCQACGCGVRLGIMVGHETRLASVQPHPGQARARSPPARRRAGLPVAGLRARGDAPRAEGADARAGILALLSRARARIQQLLQLFRRDERRCGRALPEGCRHRPSPDLEDGLQWRRRAAARGQVRPIRSTCCASSGRAARGRGRSARAETRPMRNAERKAFDTLGLEIDAARPRSRRASRSW